MMQVTDTINVASKSEPQETEKVVRKNATVKAEINYMPEIYY